MSGFSYIDILKKRQDELFNQINNDENTLDFNLNKDSAKYLIPLVERCITTISSLQPIIEKEVTVSKNSKKYMTNYKKAENIIRLKIYDTLNALYDVIQENTCLWKNKWEIKDLSNLNYNIDKQGLIAHIKLTKQSKDIILNNKKQYIKCCRWRYNKIKWFMDNIKLI